MVFFNPNCKIIEQQSSSFYYILCHFILILICVLLSFLRENIQPSGIRIFALVCTGVFMCACVLAIVCACASVGKT